MWFGGSENDNKHVTLNLPVPDYPVGQQRRGMRVENTQHPAPPNIFGPN